ncbi:MAG: hypothetical protein HY066_08740 [Betaproteobacteria bacterium]|nr:hypothetical protein [Betaproteobacteria bacterium]
MNKIYESKSLLALLVFVLTALIMTVYEATKQQIFGEMSLWESHAITVVFTSVIAAVISWWLSQKFHAHFAETKLAEERINTYQSAMRATSHYMGNILNIFQLIELDIDASGKISEESLQMIYRELQKTEVNVRGLSLLETPTPENVARFVKENL